MITIVTGDTNAYKTSYVEDWIASKPDADGILSKKRFCKGSFQGYDVEHIASGLRVEFLSLITPSDKKIGEFFIQQKGLELAKIMIRKAIEERKFVVIDELGQAELAGEVFCEELMLLLNANADALLVIRKRLLREYQTRFPQLAQAKIIEVNENEKRD